MLSGGGLSRWDRLRGRRRAAYRQPHHEPRRQRDHEADDEYQPRATHRGTALLVDEPTCQGEPFNVQVPARSNRSAPAPLMPFAVAAATTPRSGARAQRPKWTPVALGWRSFGPG